MRPGHASDGHCPHPSEITHFLRSSHLHTINTVRLIGCLLLFSNTMFRCDESSKSNPFQRRQRSSRNENNRRSEKKRFQLSRKIQLFQMLKISDFLLFCYYMKNRKNTRLSGNMKYRSARSVPIQYVIAERTKKVLTFVNNA